MSLYDDLDVKSRTNDNVSGWSSGIKLLQSQLQIKKAAVTQPKRDVQRKVSLPPVIDLKSKRDDEDGYVLPFIPRKAETLATSTASYNTDMDWNVIDEYDPLWPNEYEKIVKEMREHRERERDREDEKKREKERDRRKKSRFNDPEDEVAATPQATLPQLSSGFAGRWAEEEDEIEHPPKSSRSSGGVAIAPPPSLQETVEVIPAICKPPPNTAGSGGGGGSVAAKIMAKYGFKEGQGLGKLQQGMSSALQVEKTSKRGGRIIHEKEVMPPPAFLGALLQGPSKNANIEDEEDEEEEPTITEIMKNPSKVVLLRNMVGPGEVDDELEPEVKEECNTKYGDVISVVIHEIQDQPPEETVRIFVEFKRIESAIKAVVDLNGRFFGGRMVKATFYDTEKFDNFQLLE